eukprot:1152508-Pelagomonas_calceolata.AAC.3
MPATTAFVHQVISVPQKTSFRIFFPTAANACTCAAARSRLRKLQEQRERGVAAADRSPHAKAEYNPSEFDELVKKFEQLSWRMLEVIIAGKLHCALLKVSRPGGAVAKPDDFYRLYGLKQQ